eukprot:6206928-Pleurochrysis_carterae.AAC.1
MAETTDVLLIEAAVKMPRSGAREAACRQSHAMSDDSACECVSRARTDQPRPAGVVERAPLLAHRRRERMHAEQ